MRGLPVASLLALTVLAGCTGGGDGGDPQSTGEAGASFDDIDVEATATTGIIRGVVVDDRIVPVEGAEVAVTGADFNRSMATDAEGRFALDGLQPGTYFIAAKSPLHNEQQTTHEVVAGDNDPKTVKIQLTRLFSQEPFVEPFKATGFIQCNQAGVYYGSAPCVTDFTGIVSGPLSGVGPCTPAGCAPQLRTVQSENRGFHTAVGAGWQRLIFEMQWDESSDTFNRLGITVSYNATQRPASHNYMSVGSTSPLRAELVLGVDHENSNAVEPELLVPEGRPDLYYFVGVRQDQFPIPNVAINQQFEIFTHFFYYGIPPEGWSFIAGDPMPF